VILEVSFEDLKAIEAFSFERAFDESSREQFQTLSIFLIQVL
jgi:hypothetical protein